MLVPPLSGQREDLDTDTSDLGPLNESLRIVHGEIDLLREYLTRHLADVVTGQADVRAAVGLTEQEEHDEAVPDE